MKDKIGGSNSLVTKWAPVLEGISDDYTKRVTAVLMENQAKAILSERQNLQEEALTPGATTVGQLGTFQKFAFPLIRRVYPELIANKIVGVQPMQAPVGQIFYLGHSRAGNIGGTYGEQVIYSKYNLTYRGEQTFPIGSAKFGVGTALQGTFTVTGTPINTLSGLDGDDAISGFDLSSVLQAKYGSPSSTYGGRIASFPDGTTTLGWSVSAGEQLRLSGIPEISFHIQQQAVVARTRKMRALWTIEASQDLKAYHNIDLESELTGLLSKELTFEIDRELIEDLRMIAYGLNNANSSLRTLAGWDSRTLDNGNPNSFGDTYGQDPNGNSGFVPAAFNYDFSTGLTNDANTARSNVFVHDFTQSSVAFGGAQHIGHVYANLLALINFASQDIYKTTQRGPGTFLITSPLIATMLESSAKLEGGIAREDGPTNMGKAIEYKGKFAGKYDLYVDPLYPEDEILVGYKGSSPMDAGFVYCPYIPLQPLDKVVDPETFQPRKGIITRYGKAAITPQSRFYRIIRIVGPTASYLFAPFGRMTTAGGTTLSL